MNDTEKKQALKELRTIYLLAEKVNATTASMILKKIRDSQLNQSVYGKRFEARLEGIIGGSEDAICVICQKNPADNNIICNSCKSIIAQKMPSKKEDAPKEHKNSEKASISLKTCPSCGKQISTNLQACPECGYSYFNKQKLTKKFNKKILMPVIAVLSIVAIAVPITLYNYNRKPAAQADKLISNIGPISLDSGTAIEAAENYYDSLPEDQQGKVKKYKTLVEARENYSLLLEEEKKKEQEKARVASIEYKINEIGTVSLYAKTRIDKARMAYDTATDEEKRAVSNYEILENAERTYARLEEQQNQDRIKEAITAIDNIKDVSLDNYSLIIDARKKYNALSSDGKKSVTNYADLEAAEKELKNIQEDCLSRLKHERDDFKDADFYECSTKPKYINDRTYILPYIVQDDNRVYMRGEFNYNGDEWIFWDTVYIITDNRRYEFSVKTYEKLTDVSGTHDLVESYDMVLSNTDIMMFQDIAFSDSAVAKFSGKFEYEYTIPDKDKISMRDLLAAYDFLKDN